jgi:hypothetical protein
MPIVTRTVAKGIAPRVREPNPKPKAKKKKPARKPKQVSSESESESEEEPVKRRKRKRQRMESVDEKVEAPEVNIEEEDAGPEGLAPEDETEVGQIVHTNFKPHSQVLG